MSQVVLVEFEIGLFSVGMDDLILFLGILLGCGLSIWLVGKEKKSLKFLFDFYMSAIVFGLLGARIYHVLTPPISMTSRGITTQYYRSHLLEPFMISQGGLGFFGALLAGIIVLFWMAYQREEDFFSWGDIIVPGVALMQSVGRWADAVNQVLYGLPTALPWGIEIDMSHRLTGYEEVAIYHPLFSYESIGLLLLGGYLLWLSYQKYSSLKTGDLFLIYLIGYGTLRWGLEFLRLDISLIANMNINQIVAGALIFFASGILFLRHASWGKLT